MEKESKYWQMISNNKTIIEFNELFDECNELTSKIKSCYVDIYNKCNEGFSNLLVGKRVLLTVDDGKWSNILGLGNSGFGTTGYIHGTLSYSSSDLRKYKDKIIANESMFRLGVKKSKRFRNMFNMTLNALSKIPKIHEIISEVVIGLEREDYGGKQLYGGIKASSPFNIYKTNFSAELTNIATNGSYHDRFIQSHNIVQDVTLYHIYEQLITLLNEHLKNLKILNDEFETYMKSKAYTKLNDELEIRKVTKEL